MSLVIVDQEMIRAGRVISSTMEEIVDLNNQFMDVIETLTTKGYQEELISSALIDKATVLSNIIIQIDELTQSTITEVENYISEVDEKDQYLY